MTLGRASLITVLVLLGAGCSSQPEPVEEPVAPQGVHGRAPAAVRGTPSVVSLTPPDPSPGSEDRRAAVIDQLGLVFSPTTVLLRPGEPITFTNSESIGHNVHLRTFESNETVLNRDTDPSQSVEHVFETEGAYAVGCDVHPGMRAVIYVTAAPYAVFASQDGSFVVPDVPPGTYELAIWSADPDLSSRRTVEVRGSSTEVHLGS